MSAEAKERSKARTLAMLREMPLQELRRARELSQQQIAAVLDTTQPEVSKIERRADMYVSTLRKFVQAMGGDLDIIARFPDGSVRINQFHELEVTI